MGPGTEWRLSRTLDDQGELHVAHEPLPADICCSAHTAVLQAQEKMQARQLWMLPGRL